MDIVITRPIRVYPRVCGGTPLLGSQSEMYSGLSPRVRGNRHNQVAGVGMQGSIPACAGEPAVQGEGEDGCEVYPRVCGGTPQDRALRDFSHGLSPRVRGNQISR